MDNLESAISATVKDQHPVSDFLKNNAAGGNEAAGASEKTNKAEIPPAPAAAEKKRGRGRPPGKSNKSKKPQKIEKSMVWGEGAPQDAPILDGAPVADAGAEAAQRANAALGATMLIQTSGIMLAGDDGKMETDEFTNVQNNFDRYFLEKGIKDFPPGISLGLALGGYYIRLAATEAAQPKISMFSAWVKMKFNAIFRRKISQPIKAPENKPE